MEKTLQKAGNPRAGSMKRILLAEDDAGIVTALGVCLAREGFETVSAAGQREAEQLLEQETCDIALVDLALRDGSGFGVCRAARDRGIPVIFLTASTDENSVVTGLDMGADDYISKPFRPRELVSRIRSVLRRTSSTETVSLPGGVTVNLEKGTAEREGKDLGLTPLEFRLLSALVSRRGKLVTRNQLLEELWDIDGEFVNDNTLTVYIRRLRAKIDTDRSAPSVITTVRGLGYRVD